MSDQRAESLPFTILAELPDVDGSIGSPAGKYSSILCRCRCKGQSIDSVKGITKGRETAARQGIPDLDRPVGTRRGKKLPVRAVGEGEDCIGMIAECLQLCSSRWIPEPDCPVITGRGDRPAIGGIGHGGDVITMAAPCPNLGPLRGIKESNLAKLARVATHRDQLPAVRAEGDSANLVLKTTERRFDLTTRRIEQLDLTVAPDGEHCPVRTEGERTDCGPNLLRRWR